MTLAQAAIIGVQAAGTGLKAGAQKAASAQEAELLKFRSRLNEQRAAVVQAETEENVVRAARQGEAITAEQINEFAASGVLPSGTPLESVAHTVGQLKIREADIARQGMARAEDFKTQSRLDRISAKIAKRTGRRQVANTLLEGGTSIGLFAFDQGLFGGGGGGGGGGISSTVGAGTTVGGSTTSRSHLLGR